MGKRGIFHATIQTLEKIKRKLLFLNTRPKSCFLEFVDRADQCTLLKYYLGTLVVSEQSS